MDQDSLDGGLRTKLGLGLGLELVSRAWQAQHTDAKANSGNLRLRQVSRYHSGWSLCQ